MAHTSVRTDESPVPSADVYTEDGYFAVIPEWVLDSDVSAQAVRLYAVLRRYADQRTGQAHPSRRTLAGRLHVSDAKVVDRALTDLVRIGAIEVFARFSPEGDRTSNGYMIKRQPVTIGGEGGGENATTPLPFSTPTVGAEKGEQNQSQSNQSQLIERAFEIFWEKYPRKIAKPKARQAWTKALKAAEGPGPIMQGLARFQFSPDPQFIPHPATWLNQERWIDALQPAGAGPRKLQPWEM